MPYFFSSYLSVIALWTLATSGVRMYLFYRFKENWVCFVFIREMKVDFCFLFAGFSSLWELCSHLLDRMWNQRLIFLRTCLTLQTDSTSPLWNEWSNMNWRRIFSRKKIMCQAQEPFCDYIEGLVISLPFLSNVSCLWFNKISFYHLFYHSRFYKTIFEESRRAFRLRRDLSRRPWGLHWNTS